MSGKKKKPKSPSSTIALNKKTRHDYHLEDRFEAGIALLGWEVKSLRAGNVQLRDSHVLMENGEAFLLGALIAPLPTASTHIQPVPTRPRKLLLNRSELNKLVRAVDRKGYTIVPTAMYWKHGRAKVEIALARGKQAHDKRNDLRDRDWKREQGRLLKKH